MSAHSPSNRTSAAEIVSAVAFRFTACGSVSAKKKSGMVGPSGSSTGCVGQLRVMYGRDEPAVLRGRCEASSRETNAASVVRVVADTPLAGTSSWREPVSPSSLGPSPTLRGVCSHGSPCVPNPLQSLQRSAVLWVTEMLSTKKAAATLHRCVR